jgi:hypothetical protein
MVNLPIVPQVGLVKLTVPRQNLEDKAQFGEYLPRRVRHPHRSRERDDGLVKPHVRRSDVEPPALGGGRLGLLYRRVDRLQLHGCRFARLADRAALEQLAHPVQILYVVGAERPDEHAPIELVHEQPFADQ